MKTKIGLLINDCTGCGACCNICPMEAIKMVENNEGFLYPIIDKSKCINCNKCKEACQLVGKIRFNDIKNSSNYIAINKNREQYNNSASGGMFSGIAKELLLKNKKCYIYGAGLDDDLMVRHFGISEVKEIVKLQNSKYVQSNIGNVYSEVEDKLKNNNFVGFSGTPCQISGLYKYLGSDYKKLLTIDIICHGVPSPKLYNRYIDEMNKQYKISFDSMKFRWKSKKFKSHGLFFSSFQKDKKSIVKHNKSDLYYTLFLKGYTFRESCYNCKYAKINRISDITIGDCDSQNLHPNFHINESKSVILLHTVKAKKIWSEIEDNFDYEKLDVYKEADRNSQLQNSFSRPDVRDNIYNELDENKWSDLSNKYCKSETIIDKISMCIMLNFPERITNLLVKLKLKIKK